MLCNIKNFHTFDVGFETLRFLNPNGDVILSKERHFHEELIKEDKLSDLSGFEAILDICQKGFAILCPEVCQNGFTLTVSHVVALTNNQLQSMKVLEKKYGCETVYNFETDF